MQRQKQKVMSDFVIGKFKAKYGVSYITLAHLLDISVKTSREWPETESAPEHAKKLIKNIGCIIENCILEGKSLSDGAPYIQVLKHEIELSDKKLAQCEKFNSELSFKLKEYLQASWITRFIYLFRPSFIDKN